MGNRWGGNELGLERIDRVEKRCGEKEGSWGWCGKRVG